MSPTIKYKTLPHNNNNPSLLPIIGKIRYAADKTRPDLLVSTSIISTQALQPHDEFVKFLSSKYLKFLSFSGEKGLKLGGVDKNIKLFCFTDASYITEGDSKCQLGNWFFITKDIGTIY